MGDPDNDKILSVVSVGFYLFSTQRQKMKCVLEPPWLVLSVLSQMHVKTAHLMRLDWVILVLISSTAFGRGSLPPVVYILVYMYISNGQSISYRHIYGYVTFL